MSAHTFPDYYAAKFAREQLARPSAWIVGQCARSGKYTLTCAPLRWRDAPQSNG